MRSVTQIRKLKKEEKRLEENLLGFTGVVNWRGEPGFTLRVFWSEPERDNDPWRRETYGIHYSIVRLLRIDLNNVKQALQMIGRGRYGRCDQCQRLIRPRRLTVYPQAVECVGCQHQDRGNMKLFR